MSANSLFFVLSIGLLVGGCGESGGQSRSNSGNNGQKSGRNDVPSSRAKSWLSFEALDFGTYLSATVSGLNGSHLAVEAGYLDIRQSGSDGASTIKDYRAQSLTVMGGKSLISGKASTGCVEVTRMSAPGGSAFSSAESTGFYEGKLSFKDGKASVTKVDSSLQFNAEKQLALAVEASPSNVVVEGKSLPKQGSISFLGAFSASFGLNTILDDLNTALAKSDEDLQIEEDGASDDINLAFVTFFPASGEKFVRCFVVPGASVSLPKVTYSTLIPFRAVTATFVSQDVESVDGTLVWRATYSGSGVEEPELE